MMPVVNIGKMKMCMDEPFVTMEMGMLRRRVGEVVMRVGMMLVMHMAVVVEKFLVFM